ncbi:hypothetical protein M422DRAFT_249232 [Sphaerobolus stellatus SS14]|uniref:Uncharacterized protein n=1 Tax=Sphaerobolus stellatus (strain SS14) TaxID=990650 RepID=A0A0C9UV81_SPHS4|nr:hypothetical protein M422DRAFT_249232 [Sphaerobolus stellatus SS14]
MVWDYHNMNNQLEKLNIVLPKRDNDNGDDDESPLFDMINIMRDNIIKQADLDSYNQVRDPVLPYDEAPPSGTPDMEMEVPAIVGTSGTLHTESTMNADLELEDLYA